MRALTHEEQMARLRPPVIVPRTGGPGWVVRCTRIGCEASVVAARATDAGGALMAAGLRGWEIGDYAVACPEHGEDAAL